MNSLHPAIRYPLLAVWLVVRSLAAGAGFFAFAMVTFFVVVTGTLYTIVTGALLICGLFGLLCWLFLHDPNAMRGFFMFGVFTAVWLLPVFLVRNLFQAAMKSHDAPYLDVPPRVFLASHGSPWMRHNPSGRAPF